MEERIAKLLAKAEGTTNPHEAEAYMAKAEELMLKFGIDRANLASHTVGARREEIVIKKVVIKNGHGYADAMAKIGHAVGANFSLRTLQGSLSDGGRVVWLIGHTSDVDAAETLCNSLILQSRAQALHWWKTVGVGDDAYLARREFIYSFASGVRSRLAETRNRVVAESAAGTDVALVDRARLVDSWVDENVSVGKGRTSRRSAGSAAAAQAGFQSGREAVSLKTLK